MSLLAGLVEQPEAPKQKHRALEHIREGKWVLEAVPYQASAHLHAAAFLPAFWEQLRAEGLLELYYPGEPEKSFGSFVTMFNEPGVEKLVFALKDPNELVEDDAPKLMGLTGFAHMGQMKWGDCLIGDAGFVFFKEFWDRHTTILAARRGMAYWFRELKPAPDIIIGRNPAANKLVQRFLPSIGWTRDCQLPIPQYYNGSYSDTVLWHITREQFEEQEKG